MSIILIDGGEVDAGLGWDALTHSPGSAPGALQALAADNGAVDPTDIVVTWTEPADNGGWSIDECEVELTVPPVETDFMPAMTASNAPAPYVASASSEYTADYAGWRAFDDIVDGSNGWFTASTGSPWWLKIDLGTARTVTAFLWSPYRLDNYGYANFPKNWQFQGSNDNANWTTLVSVTDYVISANNTRVDVANDTAYRYYRWYVTNTTDGSYCLIADIRLLESSEPSQETQTGASSPITFAAKPYDTTYDIRARAQNRVGWGSWTAPLSYLHQSPFSPNDIGGLFGWWAADNPESTATIWRDSSGNNRHIQSNVGPYSLADHEGKPAWYFTTTTQMFLMSPTARQAAGNLTIFIVCKPLATTNTTGMLHQLYQTTTRYDWWWGIANASSMFDMRPTAATGKFYVFQLAARLSVGWYFMAAALVASWAGRGAF